jgi:hypothetical protein
MRRIDRVLANLACKTSKAHGISTELANLKYVMNAKAKYNIIVQGATNKFTYTNSKKNFATG